MVQAVWEDKLFGIFYGGSCSYEHVIDDQFCRASIPENLTQQ